MVEEELIRFGFTKLSWFSFEPSALNMVISFAGRYLVSSTFFLGYLAFLLYTTKTHTNVQMKQSDPTMPTIHPILNGSDVVGNMVGDADGDIVGYDVVGNMVNDADGDTIGDTVGIISKH